jgi:ATP-dependent exoDNAse (exonuclease V) beta subunit
MLGAEVHRLFEALKFQEDIDEVEGTSDPRIQKALKFLRSFERGRLLKLIETGQVEWGFTIQKNTWLIQGQIDLWSRDAAGNFVVADYKTGSEKYLEKAYEQLEVYAWALRRMGLVPEDVQLQLMVIYPFSEKVYERSAKPFSEIDKILEEKSTLVGSF